MVDHCYQHLTAEGGQKLHLIPAPPQHGVGTGRCQQARHQRIDDLAGRRKLLDALQGGAAGLLPGREHRIADGIVLVPDAELGAHPVVLGRRGKDLDGRDVQPSKEGLEHFVLDVETSFCLLSDNLPIVQTKIRLGTHYGGATLKFQVKVFLVYLRFSALNENIVD